MPGAALCTVGGGGLRILTAVTGWRKAGATRGHAAFLFLLGHEQVDLALVLLDLFDQ